MMDSETDTEVTDTVAYMTAREVVTREEVDELRLGEIRLTRIKRGIWRVSRSSTLDEPGPELDIFRVNSFRSVRDLATYLRCFLDDGEVNES